MLGPKYRILLIGCGELGSRHLQALSVMDEIAWVEVVDPRPQAQALGERRLAEVAQRNERIEYRWHTALDGAARGGDLCIVATLAQGRREQVEEVVATLDYRSIILEKTVTQSAAEYRSLMETVAETGLAVWVNCKTRAYPLHQKLKARICDNGGPLLFNVTGGNLGLATNGIHAADLFAFYDDCRNIAVEGAYIDRVLHASKRGGDLFDLSGTLMGSSERGSQFTISYSSQDRSSDHISFLSQGKRVIIDHMARCAWINETDGPEGWLPLEFEGNPLVSHMTAEFALDILESGDCALPTLQQCRPAHEFILDSLLPHFSSLLDRPLDACPVT